MFPDKDLITAAIRGDLPGVKAALALGADPYFDNGKAIEEAITNGRLEIVERLYDPVRSDTWVNQAAIWMAAENGRPEIVDFLIQQGVDVNVAEGKALQGAAFLGHVKVVELLLAAGARLDNKALKFAALRDHPGVIERLLEAGADLHAEDDFCLRHAAARGNVEMVEILVRHGADPGHPYMAEASEKHAHLKAWMDRRTIETELGSSSEAPAGKRFITRSSV